MIDAVIPRLEVIEGDCMANYSAFAGRS